MLKKILIACSFIFSSQLFAADLILKPVQVAPNVYAVIGDFGAQTYENDALNSNYGFVVTPEGVVVMNSGTSVRIAKAIHESIKVVTSKPVKWVINQNSQNQNWLGNAYFSALKVPVIALKEAADLMNESGDAQLASVKELLKDKAQGTTLSYPSVVFSDKREIILGGVTFNLMSFGTAHTPGDIVVWMPQQKILFAGDIVFTERMAAILSIGNVGGWIKAFDSAMALGAKIIVPGHGKVTEEKQATRDTKDFLATTRTSVKKILDAGGSLQDAVEKTDQSQFKYLLGFDALSKRNINQVFTELERESF
jgi:glyoxylase-like metal-dependent hydrolase (beta-lactamase superfamily II)